jgi:hypothetical protein
MWAPPAYASHSEELRRAQLVYTRIPSAIFAGGLRMTRQLDGARSSVVLNGRPLMKLSRFGQIGAISEWARQVEIESNSFHKAIHSTSLYIMGMHFQHSSAGLIFAWTYIVLGDEFYNRA